MLPLVYEELRVLARNRLRQEANEHTLNTTALVHEAYLRLTGEHDVRWENRGHFFGAAAEAMRRILIDRARKRGRLKHGGDRQRISLDRVDPAVADITDADLLALDAALTRLESVDPLRAQIVKLRYFAGLTIEQTAQAMELANSTVSGHWAFARAWLFEEIRSRNGESGDGAGGSVAS